MFLAAIARARFSFVSQRPDLAIASGKHLFYFFVPFDHFSDVLSAAFAV